MEEETAGLAAGQAASGLGTSCRSREATPYCSWGECTLTMRPDWQPGATHGNGFGLSELFLEPSHLPPAATGCDRLALSEEGPRVKFSFGW